MEEEIEIRDNFNQDVLDRTPGWLMKWGVLAVTLGMAALLGLAAVIPYNQTIRLTVTLGNEAPVIVVAQQSGTVLINNVSKKPTVKEGDTLLVISAPERSISFLIAPCTGYTVYPNSGVFNAGSFAAGDTIVKIFPNINTGEKVTAVGYSAEPIPQNRLQASRVVIKIAKAPAHAMTVNSSIKYASLIPEPGKGYLVVVEPDSTGLGEVSAGMPVYHNLQAEAAITLKKQSVIQWIFD